MAATKAAKAAAAKNDVVTDSKEIAGDVKELITDGVEFFEDSIELVKKSWIARSNPKMILAAGAAAGVLAGFGAAYLAFGSHFRQKYQKLADEQIQDVKDNYAILRKDNVDLGEMASRYPDEEKLADREVAAEIKRENGYTSYEKVTPVVEDVAVVQSAVEQEVTVTQAIVEATTPRELNVFESDMPDTYFLFEEELRRREEKPLEPHVITKDEFDANDTGFSQVTLSYYAGDDVVTDSDDKTIDDPNPVIGPENTLRFGHGSGDPNVVYLRNARLSIDIELVHSPGKYTMEVLGFDDGENSLQHSAPRKFRRDRE